MRDKLKLTTNLTAQLPEQYSTTKEQALATWWVNVRPMGGMRLTDLGYKMLSEYIGLAFYPYKIPDNLSITQQTIITLDRKLQNPYYIVIKKNLPTDIVFFSSKEAMLVNLYGDLDKFLKHYA